MKRCPGCGLLYPDESGFCFLTGEALQAMPDDRIGTTVAGLYRATELIGETAWARCYRARHRLLERPCRLKIFKAGVQDGDRARFDETLAVARRCGHHNVLELVGGGVLPDGHGFAVHVAGDAHPLELLLQSTRLDASQATGLALQILAGLARVHDFGGIHGDLRPSNVLYWSNGHADVTDVGLGRALVRDPWDDAPESFAAQPYLAPELSSRQRATVSGDLYAAGVIAFRMLAGALPIEARSVKELRAALAAEPPRDLSARLRGVPKPLADWVERMVALVPQRRPDDAHQALDELNEACAAAKVAPMTDPGRPPAKSANAIDGAFARWERYRSIFAKMVEIGFGKGLPAQAKNAYEAILGRVDQLLEIAKHARHEHGNLDDIQARAREGRQRIAGYVDELTASVQVVRRELMPLLLEARQHGDKCAEFPAQATEQHREVVQWEGRSAFVEPYRELAQAYRALADVMEKWWDVRAAQLKCEREADGKREKLVGIEELLDEQREALRIHESNIGEELRACQERLAELGKRTDELELELVDLASRFCAPLRSKPDLGACFRELAQK